MRRYRVMLGTFVVFFRFEGFVTGTGGLNRLSLKKNFLLYRYLVTVFPNYAPF